jgi:Hint domain
MSAIATTITNGITLGASGSYYSPLIIFANGAIEASAGSAIFGPGTLGAAQIVNAGTVAAATTSGVGIYLQAGGYIDNVGTGALIEGYHNAVYMAGISAGTVINSGRIIAGTSTYYGSVRIGGNGVRLASGGTVTNSGTIIGRAGTDYFGKTGGPIYGTGGIYITGAAGTITNSGTIVGEGYPFHFPLPHPGLPGQVGAVAISLAGGGSVDNIGGLITGSIAITGAAGTVTNSGLIDSGVILGAGGSVGNSGLITARVYIGGAFGTVTNSGTILIVPSPAFVLGPAPVIDLGAGGTIDNTGLIEGHSGVGIEGSAGVVANSGTIIGDRYGDRRYGVLLGAGGSVINAGTGLIEGSTGVGITGAAGTVINSGTITAVTYGINLAAGGSIGNSGGLIDGNIGVFIKGASTVTNSGTIAGATGVVIGDAGAPGDTIVNFGVISGSSGTAVVFGGGGRDTLVIEPGSTFSGALAGFRPLDTIDLVGVNVAAASLVYAGPTVSGPGTLTVMSSGTAVASLAIYGNFVTNDFTLSSDGYGGTDIAIVGEVPTGPIFGGNYTIGIVLINPLTQDPATLAPVGYVTNTYGGDAVFGTDAAAWNFTNFGTINATGTASSGLALATGGNVMNAAGALITGIAGGVYITGAPGSVANYGNIDATGTTGAGVALEAGGSLANAADAQIVGVVDGVRISGPSGAVENSGTISAMGFNGAGTGIHITGGDGSITNSGRIIAGIDIDENGSVNNMGLIEGDIYFSYRFGRYTSHLTGVGAGSVTNSDTIIGTVRLAAGGRVDNTGLIQAFFSGVKFSYLPHVAPMGAGTVTNSGTIIGSNAVELHAGGNVDNTGLIQGIGNGVYLYSAGTITNAGTIAAATGVVIGDAGAVNDTIVNFGVISGSGGTAVVFGGGGADTLVIEPGSTLSGALDGFKQLDTIDLVGVDVATASLVYSGPAVYGPGTLTVMSSGTPVASLTMNGDFATNNFALSSDGNGGTDITVCFCRGTRILTEMGEVPVEKLAVGDRVRTLSGALKPIVWIGFGLDLITLRNSLARPIIVRAGALVDGVPRRDLRLTHGHSLYFDGVLVPVEHLVNHRSILWDDAARVVEYYHIELHDHDVVLAEGAPAESYYDANNRALFHNARDGSEISPERPVFAPVLNGGDVVERIWAELFERAGGRSDAATTDDPDLHLGVDGARLDPASLADGVYTFFLAAPPVGPLRLCSRSAVPSLIGLNRHEHRRLGVAIRQIILQLPAMMTCLDHDALPLREGGCHLPEDGYSWTDGELVLPAEMFSHLWGPSTLLVHTRKQAMRYPISAALAEAA